MSGEPTAGQRAQELEALADEAWWMCRVQESLALREQAYQEYMAAGDSRRAGYNAWMLSTEYGFTGKPVAAAGWLRRAQRHAQDWPECRERGFVLYGEAEHAERQGDRTAALILAERMTEIGERCESRDVVAMSLQLQARILVAQGQTAAGLARLDEAMCDVLAGQLSDLVTGWVYCVAVAVCFEAADLGRATEWNESAMTWCESMPVGHPYDGICRAHRAELLSLDGSLDQADSEAARACAELLAYHPNMAAEAFYVAGEIRRRRGDLVAAEQAFRRAHEFGREPQPGLALVRLAQGQAAEAAAALRSCVAMDDWPLVNRARLMAALVDVALAVNDVETAQTSAKELAAISDRSDAALLHAAAATAQGSVRLAIGDLDEAFAHLRRARNMWLDLGHAYEVARTRVQLAKASLAARDVDTARLELSAARSSFVRLGAAGDLPAVDALLGDIKPKPRAPGDLTLREIEVLRLVAAGRTNREIAAQLAISQHTVGRHLNNIFTKLDVNSRAAATAFAFTHSLVDQQ